MSITMSPPMTKWRWWWCLAAVAVALGKLEVAASDPQTSLLNTGCSQYKATNQLNFFSNLNATLRDLRSQISSGESKHFATAQQLRTSDPVYAMVQCRKYLSMADCVACFDTAASQIRNCSAANGARVIYDGCFLRYESSGFYDQTTQPGHSVICGNRNASMAFDTTVDGVLVDLEVATPKTNGFFAAVKRQVEGSSAKVYAVAQCAETASESGCQDCLKVAYGNIQNNQTINISPFLGGGGSSKKKAIIWGVVGGVGLLLLLFALFSWYRLSTKAKAARRGNVLGATELQGPVNYKYKDLKSATKNFSEKNKLGEGGFGDVFKGILKNGNVVAVKRLDIGYSRAKADFDSEVRLISNVHHRNLIRLLGCCSKGPELLLVYEYMANGSLDKFLYGERRGSLNWKQRFDIIIGIARGLAYLHGQYHVCIIHRDIKSSNILLDDVFQPRIADFGLARLLPEDRSHLSTKFAGTLGYTAPEYAIHGQLSEKVDTYSFGVVILEIISGRRSNEMKVETVTEYLLEEAWNLYENDMHMNLVDETLDPNEYKEEDVKKVIEIALISIQSPVSVRPTMSELLVMLLSERSSQVTRRPNKPAFIDNDNRIRGNISISSSSSASNATASFTDCSGR